MFTEGAGIGISLAASVYLTGVGLLHMQRHTRSALSDEHRVMHILYESED